MPVEHEGALRYLAGRHQRRKLGREHEGPEDFELDREREWRYIHVALASIIGAPTNNDSPARTAFATGMLEEIAQAPFDS